MFGHLARALVVVLLVTTLGGACVALCAYIIFCWRHTYIYLNYLYSLIVYRVLTGASTKPITIIC